MSEPNSERIITPMTKSLVEAIDDYRFAARMPSRSEAIRRLIEAALKAARQRKKAA
jgi:metal-responsive CopG/Arc/MetJ family transcriptional regulator